MEFLIFYGIRRAVAERGSGFVDDVTRIWFLPTSLVVELRCGWAGILSWNVFFSLSWHSWSSSWTRILFRCRRDKDLDFAYIHDGRITLCCWRWNCVFSISLGSQPPQSCAKMFSVFFFFFCVSILPNEEERFFLYTQHFFDWKIPTWRFCFQEWGFTSEGTLQKELERETRSVSQWDLMV